MNELKLGQIVYVLFEDRIRAARVCFLREGMQDPSIEGSPVIVLVEVYIPAIGVLTLNKSIKTWATTSQGILVGLDQDVVEMQK